MTFVAIFIWALSASYVLLCVLSRAHNGPMMGWRMNDKNLRAVPVPDFAASEKHRPSMAMGLEKSEAREGTEKPFPAAARIPSPSAGLAASPAASCTAITRTPADSFLGSTERTRDITTQSPLVTALVGELQHPGKPSGRDFHGLAFWLAVQGAVQ